MANPAVARGGEHCIQLPASIADPAGDGSQQKSRNFAGRKWEKRLNRFVRFVAFGEWAGNAFGALAFAWATAVLLGGFSSSLNREDFWFVTIMIFIEAFRLFSRNNKLDSQSLFGTTRALGWTTSSIRMIGRPQVGNELVLTMGFCINLVVLTSQSVYDWMEIRASGSETMYKFYVVVLILMTKLLLRGAPKLMMNRSRWRRQLVLWGVLTAYLLNGALDSIIEYPMVRLQGGDLASFLATSLGDILNPVPAVLLLNFRPRRIANLTDSYCGRKMLSWAKVIAAVWLVCEAVSTSLYTDDFLYRQPKIRVILDVADCFTWVVLSLGTLQTPTKSLLGRCVDVILHIFFLWGVLDFYTTDKSLIALLAVLLIDNLQIPAAVAQVILSSLRLRGLLAHRDYQQPPPKYSSSNLVPSITVLLRASTMPGVLYIMACVLGVFSFFPRRWLARHLEFSGRWGAEAVDQYYQRAYTARMEIGVFAAGNTISFASYAVESLSSSSRETQLVGLRVLDRLLQRSSSREELISRIVSSSKALSTLVGMLGRADVQDRYVRLFAARVTAELSGNLMRFLFC
ncbi:uncharacterized protein C2845_PM07G15930 [Panicum miliaceum]|uniref:DUF4220 domain-containing protein n=1 Tax=Panicum miliaceum TaxID=4540 RepID=A0A3L6SI65_PANMI|nr:uncharacterized protein C2845_PM07G15930 [Panicum miliaceum]